MKTALVLTLFGLLIFSVDVWLIFWIRRMGALRQTTEGVFLRFRRSSWKSEDPSEELLSHVPKDSIVANWILACLQHRRVGTLPPVEELAESFDRELSKDDDVTRSMTHSLTGLGLLGTFVGLMVSLTSAVGAFQRFLQPMSGADNSAGELTALSQLYPVFSGMSIAFLTSIFGLLSALGLGLWLSIELRARAFLRSAMVSFAQDELLPALAPAIMPAPEDFGGAIRALEATLGAVERIFTKVNDLDKNIHRLGESIHGLEMFYSEWQADKPAMERLIDGFHARAEGMEDHLSHLAEGMERSLAHLETVGEELQATKHQFDAYQKAFKEIMEKIDDRMSLFNTLQVESAKLSQTLADNDLAKLGAIENRIAKFDAVESQLEAIERRIAELKPLGASASEFLRSLQLMSQRLTIQAQPKNIRTLIPRIRDYLFPTGL